MRVVCLAALLAVAKGDGQQGGAPAEGAGAGGGVLGGVGDMMNDMANMAGGLNPEDMSQEDLDAIGAGLMGFMNACGQAEFCCQEADKELQQKIYKCGNDSSGGTRDACDQADLDKLEACMAADPDCAKCRADNGGECPAPVDPMAGGGGGGGLPAGLPDMGGGGGGGNGRRRFDVGAPKCTLDGKTCEKTMTACMEKEGETVGAFEDWLEKSEEVMMQKYDKMSACLDEETAKSADKKGCKDNLPKVKKHYRPKITSDADSVGKVYVKHYDTEDACLDGVTEPDHVEEEPIGLPKDDSSASCTKRETYNIGEDEDEKEAFEITCADPSAKKIKMKHYPDADDCTGTDDGEEEHTLGACEAILDEDDSNVVMGYAKYEWKDGFCGGADESTKMSAKELDPDYKEAVEDDDSASTSRLIGTLFALLPVVAAFW